MSSVLRLRAAARRPGMGRNAALLLALALAASNVGGQHTAREQRCAPAAAALIDATHEAQPERRGEDTESAAGGGDNATPVALRRADEVDDAPSRPLWLARGDGRRDGHLARLDRPPDLA